MKIVYLANVRMPTDRAHGIQIMKMCEAIASAGHEVELVVPKRFNQIKTDPFIYYQVKKIFKIRKLFCIDLLIFQLGPLGFFIQTFSFFIIAKFYLWFSHYDILYMRSEFAGIFFNNYVVEVHTLPYKVKAFHKKTWRKAKKIIVLTSFIKIDLIKLGVAEGKIIVAPDGVDLNQFDIKVDKDEARKKLNLPLDKKIILYSGTFNMNNWLGWKGVDTVLETAKIYNPEHLFILIGGDPEEIDLIIKKYNLTNLLLIPHQEQKIIPYYLKSADILLLPNKKGNSNSERHTSPLKLFEYMAAGRPIIASKLPSLMEILNDNNCLFFEPNNPKDLAEKIKLLFLNFDLAKNIAERARLDVSQYIWEKRANKIFNFIKNKHE